MKQNSELESEDEESESSSIDSYSITFDNASELSYPYDYYSSILLGSTDYKKLEEKFKVEALQLEIGTYLGEGHFGCVHKGELSVANENISVAIKKPKATSNNQKLQRDVLKGEMMIMAYLQQNESNGHENILKLVGAITTNRINFCIITEFCDLGSLDKFLSEKHNRNHFQNEINLHSYEENECSPEKEYIWKIQQDPSWNEQFEERRNSGIITTSDLLWFALQIARAMQFLTEMKVVHRDMALRNVLLKPDFTIKVADFGLSRRLSHGDESYKLVHNIALPIKYTALESLKTGRFSIHSECWSFGVVVWELFTFARQKPYSAEYELYGSRQRFFDFLVGELAAGRRLTIPPIVPKALKNLVTELWNRDPESRPSFQKCRKTIREILVTSCPQIVENTSDCDNSNACKNASLNIEERFIEPSSEQEIRKSSWLLKLIILSVAIILVSASVIIALIALPGSHEPLQPCDVVNKSVRWIPGVNIDNAIFLHPMPVLDGVIILNNTTDIIFVQFTCERSSTLDLENINTILSDSYILLSAVVITRSNNIYYVCLHGHESDDSYYFIAYYEQGQSNEKLVQRIDPKETDPLDIGQQDVANYTKKLYTDEKNEIFCIFSGWQTTESGTEDTIFYVYQIIVSDNGKLSVIKLNGMQPGKIIGKYFAPFFLSNSLYWSIQQVSINNSITAIKITNLTSINLSSGEFHYNELANFNSVPDLYPNFLTQSAIHIKDHVCYFASFESLKGNALFCLTDPFHTWRIFYWNGQQAFISNVVISSISVDNKSFVYLHGYTESNEPFFEIMDFDFLMRDS